MFLLFVVANSVSAGPLFDPFLERFQVGAFSDPEEITMASGFPMGLLEPAQVDREWVRAARLVLRSEGPFEDSPYLTQRMLSHMRDTRQAAAWLSDREMAVADLVDNPGTEFVTNVRPTDFLGREILARRFFMAIRKGLLSEAAALAGQLAPGSGTTGWSERSAFVWELRARILGRILGAEGDGFTSPLWKSMLKLGPFDSRNAWALWVAHCRDLERPVLPDELATDAGELFLAGLGKSWMSSETLYQSSFNPAAQAALGAGLFRGKELADHMARFPEPPSGLRRQGAWVKGARFARRGQADAYEELAQRTDLNPGWKMDIWRRASELRYLAGQKTSGLANLEQALDIAARQVGTLPLRRRLRQWSEQSMVLCLAQGDTVMARRIFDLARDSFRDEEATAFTAETTYWVPLLFPNEDPTGDIVSGDLKARAKRIVEAGDSPRLEIAGVTARQEFRKAGDRPLWEAWTRWGLALTEAKGLSGDRKTLAMEYKEILLAGLARFASSGDSKDLESCALSCLALRHGTGTVGERLLDSALDLDIVQARGWQGSLLPSVVPDLARELRGSQLDLHALLGYCLAAGDMRGTLAVAYGLPGKGLEPEEKLRFLYPLPGPGPVRDAILAGDAEPALVLAVARNESLFEPNVRSRAGALGFMQIMPFHYESRGALPGAANWACPDVSILKGGRILVENRGRYRGDPYLAVAAYNAGPSAAARWQEQLGGHPAKDIYLAWIGYPETRRYVEKVLIDREIYDWIINAEPVH